MMNNNMAMSQSVYQMLGNQAPALYNNLSSYGRQLGNFINQNGLYYIFNPYTSTYYNDYQPLQNIGNMLMTGDIHPNSSSAGNSL